MADRMRDIEPYHPPAELYNQNDLDTLHAAGFKPHSQPGVWHRYINPDQLLDPEDVDSYRDGSHMDEQPGHFIFYNPGLHNKQGQLVPWALGTRIDEKARPHFRLDDAIQQADAERAAMRSMPPHQARTYLSLVAGWEDGYRALAASRDAEDEAFDAANRKRVRDRSAISDQPEDWETAE